MSRELAALGVRVKTGRATVVLVAGTRKQPRVVARRELVLHDPAIPYSGQPYHAPLELGDAEAKPVLALALATVRKVGKRELGALVKSLEASSHKLGAVGFVVGSLGDPAKLGNPHVRAHALEGQLYWKALEEPARELSLPCSAVTEKEIYLRASESLGKTPEALRAALAELGKPLGKPWGAEEKTAALAGWTALKK